MTRTSAFRRPDTRCCEGRERPADGSRAQWSARTTHDGAVTAACFRTSAAWCAQTTPRRLLFEFRGRTIFEGDEPGRQNLVGWFESDYETYRWLNDLVCVAEGLITDAAWRSTCTRAYTTRAIESLRAFYRASSILRLEAMAGPGSVDEAALSACLRGDRLPLGPCWKQQRGPEANQPGNRDGDHCPCVGAVSA